MSNINKTVLAVGGGVVVVMITAITILIALDKDPSTLVAFMVGSIVPSAISYLGLQKAGQAKDAAETTVLQTNGRMTELIANNRVLVDQVTALSGGPSAPLEEKLSLDPEYVYDAEGHAVLRRKG
jgi:hypothetical protein